MTLTVEELRAYRAEHREMLQRLAAEAPPPPDEALEIARATGCPTLRPTRYRAAS